VTNGDDEVPAEEEGDLADVDHLVVVDVADGFQHREALVAVALDLGALVRVHGVLHRQRRQVEDRREPVDVGRRGSVQPDPDEPAGGLRLLQGLRHVVHDLRRRPGAVQLAGHDRQSRQRRTGLRRVPGGVIGRVSVRSGHVPSVGPGGGPGGRAHAPRTVKMPSRSADRRQGSVRTALITVSRVLL
jgi:hypothetical protein